MASDGSILYYVYKTLFDYSDERHPLKQQDIIDLISKNYDVTCERRSISRAIQTLDSFGFEFVSGHNGTYLLTRTFEQSELRLLIDSVLGSTHINTRQSKDLVNKLKAEGGKYFSSRVKHIQMVDSFNKAESTAQIFTTIDAVDEAIDKGVKVSFDYCRYDKDKKLQPRFIHIVSPYQMVLHNQHYYLIAKDEKFDNVASYRVEKIKNIKITNATLEDLRSLPGYKNGLNYKELSTDYPYMFTDEPEEVVLECNEYTLDAVVDWFGKDITVQDLGDDKLRIRLKSSLQAMEYWAMQYCKFVEIISPVSLRNKVKTNLENALKKYE